MVCIRSLEHHATCDWLDHSLCLRGQDGTCDLSVLKLLCLQTLPPHRQSTTAFLCKSLRDYQRCKLLSTTLSSLLLSTSTPSTTPICLSWAPSRSASFLTTARGKSLDGCSASLYRTHSQASRDWDPCRTSNRLRFAQSPPLELRSSFSIHSRTNREVELLLAKLQLSSIAGLILSVFVCFSGGCLWMPFCIGLALPAMWRANIPFLLWLVSSGLVYLWLDLAAFNGIFCLVRL